MKSKIVLAVAGGLAAMTLVTSASAATITRIIDFTASDFYTKDFRTAPITDVPVTHAPISGEFSITFDPASAPFLDRTAGITLNMLSVGLDSPIAYNYGGSFGYGGVLFPVSFMVGANNLTVSGLRTDSKDFLFEFYTDPSFETITPVSFHYAGPSGLIFTSDIEATISAAVPEPGVWAMMLAGVAMLGGMLRRRRGGERPLAVV